MKRKLLFIFIISCFWGSTFKTQAQNKHEVQVLNDTVVYQERYGLRLGVDLSRPGRALIDKKYTGFEIKGDYRLKKRIFPAAEIGFEDFDYEENYLTANSQGSYIKLGVNYNAYKNWIGMQNELYAGVRYGFSTFSERLNEFTIYNQDHYFPSDFHEEPQKFSGLSAHWLELQIGLKAEVLHNVFLGVHVELKRLITDKAPGNFDNLWIPGFNRHYEGTEFGVGWGYSISYLIPFFHKERREVRD